MRITINPITDRLKEIVKQYGASGWVVLRNDPNCCQRANQPASLVCKDNKMLWLTQKEIK